VADRQSVNAAFSFDVSEIRREVYYKYGRNSVKWLVEELTAGVSDSAKIAQAEANARIKGGSGSRLAQASKVVTRSSAKEIEGKVDWDSARSAAGFPYAAAVRSCAPAPVWRLLPS
jgi:orotate phosphoribosyltransferase-like protein